MANHKSAEKRRRSSERKRSYNRRVKTLLKTKEKLLLESVKKKDRAAVAKSLNGVFSILDKAKKSGVIHRNTAARKKSRLSQKAASYLS